MDHIDNWLVGWTICSIAAYFIPVIGTITIHPFGPYFIAGATFFLVWKDKMTAVRGGMLIICIMMSIYETIQHTKVFIFEDASSYEITSATIVFCFYIMMAAITLGHIKIGERTFLFKLTMMTYPMYLIHNILDKQIYDALDMNKYLALILVMMTLFVACYVLALYVDRPLNRASNRLLNKLHDRIVKN